MPSAFLRRSPLVARLRSWLQGTRFRTTGRSHRCDRSNALLVGTEIEITGEGCILEIGEGARLWDCSLKLAGRGSIIRIGAGCRLRKARLVAEDAGSRLLIGDHTTMTGPTLVAQEGKLVRIGRDCMIAQNAEIRNSDSHGIHDEVTNERLNPAADITIGDHVWICVGSFVLKGAQIADGAVIAAGALVTGDIPPGCIATGKPARPVKQGIAWKRERTNPTTGSAS